MNTAPDRFLMPKEQVLSWSYLARRSRCERLPGIADTARRYCFFWARNAIYHSLDALGIAPGERVLVPAYICAAAIEPIAAYGAVPKFYEVHRDCRSDFSALEAAVDARTRAVLAVHYFGFPQAIREFRQLCDRHGLSLIEDCAHVLLGELDGQVLGSFGDASVFSWRKFLPLYDGGELVLNRGEREPRAVRRSESLLFTLKVAKSLFDQRVEQSRHPALRVPYMLLQGSKNILLRLVGAPGARATALAVNGSSASYDPQMVDFPMSRLSRVILTHSDISQIAARRRANYRYLQDALARVPGLRLLFRDLPGQVCPWVLPLFFEDFPNAHLPLRRMGIPAVTWGGVRHPAIPAGEFPDADFLYENLIFLPIHQQLRRQDLDLIVEAVKTVRHQGCASGGAAPTT